MTDENINGKLDAENTSEDGTVDASKPFHVHSVSAETGNCECGYTIDNLIGEVAFGAPVVDTPNYGVNFERNAAQVDADIISAQAYQRGYSDGNTPNVVIENATTRKVANTVIACAGIVLACVTAADVSSPDFDLSRWTEPAWAVYGILQGAFGLAVVNSNIPKVR